MANGRVSPAIVGRKYCRMLPLEHSAILSTFIKLPFVIKIFVVSIFEWPLLPFYTGFTVFCLIFPGFRMSVSRGSKTIKVVYPSGCKEVTDELGKDELVRRLKVYMF